MVKILNALPPDNLTNDVDEDLVTLLPINMLGATFTKNSLYFIT